MQVKDGSIPKSKKIKKADVPGGIQIKTLNISLRSEPEWVVSKPRLTMVYTQTHL